MPEIGYALSSEEHTPNDLVRNARMAEEAGFTFALISDHYHPWTDTQGHSPFVWSVIGGIAQQTRTLRLGTGVTAPILRIHPAIIAQAAATSALMLEGRFFLGVGTGEHLNEHILGDKWPEYEVRAEMLEESIELMRLLWEGENISYQGNHFVVENARVYDVPADGVPVYVAASGTRSGELAGRVGDGFIGVSAEAETVQAFEEAGGRGKPKVGQLTVCYAEDEREAIRTALEIWPNGAIKGAASQELPLPEHFGQLAEMVTEESIAEAIVCGPDPEKHLAKIREYEQAGYDQIYIHQVGEQEAFFRFYAERILPAFRT